MAQQPQSPELFGDSPPGRIAAIMRQVRTIAIVGASDNPARASHRVMQFLAAHGFEVIAVNPKLAGGQIGDVEAVASLAAIDRPVDMVDVFRASDALPEIVDEAIAIGAKVLWTQLGVIHDPAAIKAHDAGLAVVVDRCPMIEFAHGALVPAPADAAS
jgi:predicted CoA-binding protein